MTLIYNLFGIPRTFEEFVDKVRKSEQTQVDVVTWSYYDSHFNCYVELQAGETRLNLKKEKWYGDFVDNVHTIQRILLEKAIEAGEKLGNFGLQAIINGELIDKARERVNVYVNRERGN